MRSSSFLRTSLVGLVVFLLSSASSFASQLVVAWDDVTGETGYRIERSTDGTTFAQIATVAADVTSYCDAMVVAGTSYWYRVQAFNATATSGYSNIATGTVQVAAIAPTITTQPQSRSVAVGASVSFSVSVSGSPTPTLQWFKNGVSLSGATSGTLSLPSVTTLDAGTYTVVATNSAGSVTSSAAVLTVNTLPSFTQQPVSQTCMVGATITFSVAVTGSPTPSMQWYKDGVIVAGATSTTLTLSNVPLSAAGAYSVVATNSAGTVTSNSASLSVSGSAPSFTLQPTSQVISAGQTFTLSVAVSGSPAPTLQWKKNGVAITGATSSSLTVVDVAGSSVGTYTAVATNTVGSATSTGASITLAVVATVPGRLSAVSVRSISAPWGSAALQLGFTVTGAQKSLLLRAVGPGLDPYTTLTVSADPSMKLMDGSTQVAANDNWGGSTALSDAFARVGAFPLATTSKDAALLTSVAPKAYLVTTGGQAQGLLLGEIYDADTSSSPVGRLASVNARSYVGTGEAVFNAGFVIAGDTPVRLLVRAIGPALNGLQGVLNDPQLEIYRGSTLVARNDNWGGGSALSSLFKLVGASSLSNKSKDSALDVTLAPGIYSAVITGVKGATGLARIEFYVVP